MLEKNRAVARRAKETKGQSRPEEKALEKGKKKKSSVRREMSTESRSTRRK